MIHPIHRLHPQHTGRTESDAVAVAQGVKECSTCLKPLSHFEKPPFHCNQCDYTVCATCDTPKSHPVHPNHEVYLITPTSPWTCDVCKRDSANIQETSCYNCKHCDFHLCKKCFAGVNSPLHGHTLQRTDARFVYLQSNGKWNCGVCRKNNGPGHFYLAHCSTCEFDLCENCIKPYRSTFHEGHILYKADSNVTYPRCNGGWRCDKCSRSFIPERNNLPFHCSQCEFDLCESCMKTTADAPRPAVQGSSGPRGRAQNSQNQNPICSPSDESDQQVGLPGTGDCVICIDRPKDATIVHGSTGHVCCCITCALQLYTTGQNCPICRAPIQSVIKQYTV